MNIAEKREELRKILQNTDEITSDELAKKMNVSYDEFEHFLYDVMEDCRKEFKGIAYQFPFWKKDKLEWFFQKQIVDLRFLCPHKIIEIRDACEEKQDTVGHQMFYNNWLLYRGY